MELREPDSGAKKIAIPPIQWSGQIRIAGMKLYQVLLTSGGSGHVTAEGYTRIGELIMFFRGPSKGWVASYRSDLVASIRDVSVSPAAGGTITEELLAARAS